jgi:hypothetical protein
MDETRNGNDPSRREKIGSIHRFTTIYHHRFTITHLPNNGMKRIAVMIRVRPENKKIRET